MHDYTAAQIRAVSPLPQHGHKENNPTSCRNQGSHCDLVAFPPSPRTPCPRAPLSASTHADSASIDPSLELAVPVELPRTPAPRTIADHGAIPDSPSVRTRPHPSSVRPVSDTSPIAAVSGLCSPVAATGITCDAPSTLAPLRASVEALPLPASSRPLHDVDKAPEHLLPHTELFPPRAPPPPRPNTDTRVNVTPRNAPAVPTVSTSLNEDAWSYYLREYPDRDFVSTIIHIIRHGANLGFTGDKTSSQSCKNLKSAFDSPTSTAALDADISAQVSKGCTAGPFLTPPFENFRCSPLGAVTRKRSTKVRRIHHLSWPRGHSVNDSIADSEASINYDMIDRAVSDLIASGPGSLMIKLDLESAFRHIPVRREDWHLLGFTWEDRFYYDLVLGFGCRSAPYIFNLFAEALHWILQRHLPARVRHYLDDFLKMFSPDIPPDTVQKALEWALALGEQLGLHFQPLKIFGPATVLEFLGLELDSISSEVRLPEDKLTYLLELLTSWSQRTHCRLSDLLVLTGFLQFASQVVPTSRAFLRGLYDFSTEFKTYFTRRRIPKSAHQDIEWWLRFASGWNGVRFFSPLRATIHVYTDASGLKGLGGHFGSNWFAVKCPRRYRHEHIQVKEMLAVVHAILCWGDKFSGKHVIFHVDNEAVYNALTSFSIRSTPTMHLLRHFLALACRLDFTFTGAWLSSKANAVADAASRFAYKRMFELAPSLNSQPSSKCLRLNPPSMSDASDAVAVLARPLHITFGMDRRKAGPAEAQPLRAEAPLFIPRCASLPPPHSDLFPSSPSSDAPVTFPLPLDYLPAHAQPLIHSSAPLFTSLSPPPASPSN